jgi:predicted HTH domain antitoxin
MGEAGADLAEETAVALKVAVEAGEAELHLAAAVKLYEVGRLSAGATGRVAGLPLPVFLGELSAYGVPAFRLTEAELRRDVDNA